MRQAVLVGSQHTRVSHTSAGVIVWLVGIVVEPDAMQEPPKLVAVLAHGIEAGG